MRLLLIRHGQTPANVRGEVATVRPGPELTELGRRQADAVPQAVAGEQIAAIYISPLLRTALTFSSGPVETLQGEDGATVDIEDLESVEITSVRESSRPEYAELD